MNIQTILPSIKQMYMGLLNDTSVTSLSRGVKQDQDYAQMETHVSCLFHSQKKKTCAERALSVFGTKTLHSLPCELRTVSDFSECKKSLKIYLFQ